MRRSKESMLMEYLASAQTISLKEAIALLESSESTVRRLFLKLEQEGQVLRTRYGLQFIPSTAPTQSFEENARSNMVQKRAIAREAVKLLENGDLLYCDPGTTVYCFCEELLERVQAEHNLKLHVVTSSLMLLSLLSPHVPVILLSGEYSVRQHAVEGTLAEQLIRRLYFSKCFLGAEGYSNGLFYTRTPQGASFARSVIANSQQTITLMDSSKFKLATRVVCARDMDVDCIITDDQLAIEEQRKLQGKPFSVHIAKTIMD